MNEKERSGNVNGQPSALTSSEPTNSPQSSPSSRQIASNHGVPAAGILFDGKCQVDNGQCKYGCVTTVALVAQTEGKEREYPVQFVSRSSDIRTPQSPSGVWTEEEWEAAKKRAAERAKSFGIEPLAPSGSTGWLPIESADPAEDRIIGGYRHPRYGWMWAKVRYHPDPDGSGHWESTSRFRPTHWLPIPPPPDGAQSNRGSDEQKHPDNSTVETTQEPKRWTYTGYDLPPFVGPPPGGSPDGD